MDFNFMVSQRVKRRVQPKQDDERKDKNAVHVQFHRTAKITVSEKQECPYEPAARAGDSEYVLQQAHAEDFAVKGGDYDRCKKNPGQKHETTEAS